MCKYVESIFHFSLRFRFFFVLFPLGTVPYKGRLYNWLLRMRKDYVDLQEGKDDVFLRLHHVVELSNLGFDIAKRKQTRNDKMEEYKEKTSRRVEEKTIEDQVS